MEHLTPGAARTLYSHASTDKSCGGLVMQNLGIEYVINSVGQTKYTIHLSDGIESTTAICYASSFAGLMIDKGDISLYTMVKVVSFSKEWSDEEIPLVVIEDLDDPFDYDIIGSPTMLDVCTAAKLATEARSRELAQAERTKQAQERGFKEAVQFTIIALNTCEDDSDQSMEVCKILLQIIHEAEQRNPGRDIMEDVSEVSEKELYPEALMNICSYIEELNVLPLISRHLSRINKWTEECIKRKTLLSEPVYLRRLLFVATSLKDLKYVVEILYFLAKVSTGQERLAIVKNIYPQLQNLLLKVKAHWEDEELIHGTVKLMSFLIEKSPNLAVYERIVNDGAIFTLSTIFSLLHAKDPEIMSLERTMNYPKRCLFVEPLALSWLYSLDRIASSADYRIDLMKEIRPLVPIMCQALSELRINKQLARVHGVDYVMDIVHVLLSSEHRDDFQKFVVHSGMIVEVVKTYEKYPDGCYCDRFPGPMNLNPFVKAVEMFFELCARFPPEITEEKIDMLAAYATILNSERLFDSENRLYTINGCGKRSRADMPPCIEETRVRFCLGQMIDFLAKENKSKRFLDIFCDESEDYIGIMIKFAKNDPSFTETAVNTISLILSERNCPKVLGHAITILLDRPCHETYHRAKKIMKKPSVFDFVVGTFEKRDQYQNVGKIVETLLAINNKHGLLNILRKDSIMRFLPVLWKRVNQESELRDAVSNAAQLTVDLSLVLPLHQLPNISLFESNLVLKIRKTGLSKPGVIRLAWSMVKFAEHEQLIEELTRLYSDEFFTDQRRVSSEKIFDFLSKIIIKRLEEDPPESDEYLVKLTSCMIEIAKHRTLQEESSHLEQMVSPAMWLLERVSSDVVIENIRHFIRILR